jgi:hypothetical protein
MKNHRSLLLVLLSAALSAVAWVSAAEALPDVLRCVVRSRAPSGRRSRRGTFPGGPVPGRGRWGAEQEKTAGPHTGDELAPSPAHFRPEVHWAADRLGLGESGTERTQRPASVTPRYVLYCTFLI